VQQLLSEIDSWQGTDDKIQDCMKTSLKPYIELSRDQVNATMKAERAAEKRGCEELGEWRKSRFPDQNLSAADPLEGLSKHGCKDYGFHELRVVLQGFLHGRTQHGYDKRLWRSQGRFDCVGAVPTACHGCHGRPVASSLRLGFGEIGSSCVTCMAVKRLNVLHRGAN
jgi:hypothetical protein